METSKLDKPPKVTHSENKIMLSSLVSVSGNFPIWVMKTEIPIRASLLTFIRRGSSRRIFSAVYVLTSESNRLLSSFVFSSDDMLH